MNLFGRRPLALFCALYATASVCGCLLTAGNLSIHIPVSVFFAFLSVLFLILLIFLPSLRARFLTLTLACLFISSAFLASWVTIGKKTVAVADLYETKSNCVLQIQEILSLQSYGAVYRGTALRLGDKDIDIGAILTFDFETDFEVGDILQGDAFIYPIGNESNNSSLRYADGIFLSLESENDEFYVIGHTPAHPVSQWLVKTRDSLSQILCRLVEGEEGNLVSSLLLGKRELLGGGTIRDFRRSGVSHLLAISGLHLSIMIAFADFFLRGLRIKKHFRCIAVLFFAFFYLALTGFALSTVRAFIMSVFLYLSFLLRSDNDPITSLFFALFLILAISPFSVYDIGMWMSFSAVLGILVTNELISALRDHLRTRHAKLKKSVRLLLTVLSTLSISVAATLFTCFPLWFAFDEMSLLSVPSGILLSPLVTITLVLAPPALLFSSVSWLAPFFGKILHFVCRAILWTVSWFSSWHGSTVSLRYPVISIFVPLTMVIVGLLLVVRFKHKWMVAATACTIILCFACTVTVIRFRDNNTVITDFRSLGENEILVFSGNEESIVCDMTTGSYSPVQLARELSEKRYSTQIGAYVLTHYHSRQVPSLSRLLASAMVRHLCLPTPQNNKELGIFSSLLALAHKNRVDVLVFDRGVPFVPGNLPLSLSVFPETYLKRSTHPTFAISAVSNQKTFLYVAESAHESKELYDLLCREIPDAFAVIFGIHGPISKSHFSYPIENVPYVIFSNESLLPFWTTTEVPCGKIISDADSFTISQNKT